MKMPTKVTEPARRRELVEISLSANEIMDYVDDMLAWLAIASESPILYEHSHYLRAVPLILVGGEQYGILTPSSAKCSALDEAPQEEQDAARLAYEQSGAAHLPRLLARYRGVRYARIFEHRAEQEVGLHNGVPRASAVGDDMGQESNGAAVRVRGARYSMESIGECAHQLRKQYVAQLKLPQIARVFEHNSIVIREDGRATSGVVPFAYWNGTLFDVRRRKLKAFFENGEESPTNRALYTLLHGIQEAINREVSWDVELALGARRTGIALKTDAIGARELVNLLRKSETKAGRRKSLVHWVDEHMRRQRRDDPEATIRVKAHLRGLAGLDAGGYYARIWPATGALDAASNGDRYRGAAQRAEVEA